MPGQAKSDTKKQQIAREAHDGIMACVVIAYQIELAKGPYQRHQGARTICSDFQQLYYNETDKSVKLSHSTLIRLAAGGKAKHSQTLNSHGLQMKKQTLSLAIS